MSGRNNSFSARKVAFGGILLALSALTLVLASILPTSKLALYALSTFYVAVFIIEFGIKSGWVFYIASALLGFVTMRGFSAPFLYAAFFGIYGVIKFYIEKLNNILLEYILKIIFYNIILFAAITFISNYIMGLVKVDFPWWIVIVASEIVFIIYDYVLSMLLQYYKDKLRRFLKK